MEECNPTMNLEINSSPEVAKGVFANLSLAASTPDISRIDFIYVDDMTAGQNDEQAAYLVARIHMNRELMKSLHKMLERHLYGGKAQ